MIVMFLLVTLVPIAIITYIGVTLAHAALVSQGDINLRAAGTHTASTIDRYLTEHLEEIEVFGKSPVVMTFASNPNDLAARTNALSELTASASRTDYNSVAIVNSEGRIILSSAEQDMGTEVSSQTYFQEALKGLSTISDPLASPTTDQPAIYFCAPIRDTNGNTLAAVCSRLDPSGVWGLVERDQDVAGLGTIGILFDENGIRIAHSTSRLSRVTAQNTLLYRAAAPIPDAVVSKFVTENRFGFTTRASLQILPLPEVYAQLEAPIPTVFEGMADNSTVRHRAVVVPLEAKPWHYVLMTPLPTFTNAADTFARIAFGLALGVALIVIVLALFFARAITQPIIQLTRVAERISLGRLDAKIDVSRKDEIGELAMAVRRMQASLQAAIERLRTRRTIQAQPEDVDMLI
jgi:HAMP domain-containing protein